MNNADKSTDKFASLPLLPVRRLSNFVYCPRLLHIQWVENLFEENADTVAGSRVHGRVDAPSKYDEEKAAALAAGLPEGARLRSLSVESESLGLTGVIDLIEGDEFGSRIVDYKKGAPRRLPNGAPIAKEYDAIQVVAYALLLAEQGTPIAEASVYYAAEKIHVPVDIGETARADCRLRIAEARISVASGKMPPPLVNDARCSYCSAYPICLPIESHRWASSRAAPDTQLLLFDEPAHPGDDADMESDTPIPPPRPDHDAGEVLVVQKAGAMVGQRGGEIVVSFKDETLRKLPLHQVRAIYLYGAVQLTAQAVESCLENDIDVAYFAASGRFLGLLRGLPASGIDARMGQYHQFEHDFFRLRLARECVAAKIHNQRVMLQRNGDPTPLILKNLANLRDDARRADSLSTLLGIEGAAAAAYFGAFASMIKSPEMAFDFNGRNRRPPRDPVNALLSLSYSILAKELAGVCHAVGLDPFLGFYHAPRYGRPALALDLMEEFRPLVADSVALSLVNRGELGPGDFVQSTKGVFLNDSGRRTFWDAWFRRLDTEVTHPEFGYKMSYRRMFEVQARQLWRCVRGEAPEYHPFTTR